MTALVAAMFGLAFGSFANATVGRTRTGRSVLARSRCDGCTRVLSAWELVPVISYLLLRGRCATCGERIGARTLAVEGACGVAFGIAFVALGPLMAALACAVFVGLLVVMGSRVPEAGR
jgi:prepilin signal peptidase PulO-like enzyme (type II secretory pathway)